MPNTPPPAALTLVSAVYVPASGLLILSFDRDIDISGFDGSQFNVVDGNFTGFIYDGHSSLLLDPVTVQIALSQIGPAFILGLTMSATALTGIVAVNDGGTWAGVTGLALPFP